MASLFDASFFAGVAAASTGLWLWSPAAGLVFVGFVLMAVGLMGSRAYDKLRRKQLPADKQPPR